MDIASAQVSAQNTGADPSTSSGQALGHLARKVLVVRIPAPHTSGLVIDFM